MFTAAMLVAVLFAGNSESTSVEKVDLHFLRQLDLNGNIQRLEETTGRAGTAVIFIDPTLPNVAECMAELNRISDLKLPKPIELYGVISSDKLSRSDAAALTKNLGAKFPILFDSTGELATRLKPSHLPEAVLIGVKGEVVYRGKISDSQVQATYLQDAVVALADNKPLTLSEAHSEGVAFSHSVPKDNEIVYTRHIAPLLFAHCAECHRPGQVAPFSLLSYEDASKRATFLSDVTSARRMPPWMAEKNYGHFVDERRLSDNELALITSWVKSGSPKGDDADMPPVPSFPEGWRLGTPDLVVEVPAPYDVPADGPDVFQHFVLPVKLPADKTLAGFEFRPSNAAVSHHAVIFFDSSGQARTLDEETPEPGYRTSGSVGVGVTAMVGVWTPGMTPHHYPPGIGVHVPKSVDIVLQLHLHPTGRPEKEQSKVALYFSDKPATEVKRQEMLLLGSLAIDIPAGKERHTVHSSLTLPIDVTLLSVFPHLHLIGKEMKVVATPPKGDPIPLIWIKDWNFYWQDSYLYQEPLRLPKGTKIVVEAAYNNSPENPANPSTPPKRVLFGNGSSDEMCFAFFQIVTDEPKAMMRIAPALMQSFLAEWQKAEIDDEAREKIVDEAGKLFGRRSTQMLRNMLLRPSKEGNRS
ncbi:alkyl hydroperoxide reductase [bacterium]|nr:alkyl hydroperoxide reductase [bacterium]